MRCKHVTRRLDAYATGEVSARDRVRIDAHLEGCASCRRALADLESMAGLLSRIATPPVPEGLASRVMFAALSRRAEPRTARWNPVQWWRMVSVPMRAAAAAMLVLGAVAGLFMGWSALPSSVQTPGTRTQADPLDAYSLDYLTDSPKGSLADSYLTLLTGQNGEGQ